MFFYIPYHKMVEYTTEAQVDEPDFRNQISFKTDDQ